MGYKTLVVRESEKLRLYLDNIVVETNTGELRFQISDLKILIIDNNKCSLSVSLLNKLADNNVDLILCNLSHLPNCQILPLNGFHASSKMKKMQIEWNEEMKEVLHQYIIKAKIQSQIDILRANNKAESVISKLKQFQVEVQLGDSTNREGLSAKMYFRELFGTDFIRFNDDIINAALNYGYAVFRSLISSILVSKGLILNFGIFHKGAGNNTNLSDDFIEVFRPIVDDYVYNHISINGEELLTKEHRDALIQLTDKKVEIRGQFQTISNAISMYVDSVINCFENDSVKELNIPSIENIK